MKEKETQQLKPGDKVVVFHGFPRAVPYNVLVVDRVTSTQAIVKKENLTELRFLKEFNPESGTLQAVPRESGYSKPSFKFGSEEVLAEYRKEKLCTLLEDFFYKKKERAFPLVELDKVSEILKLDEV